MKKFIIIFLLITFISLSIYSQTEQSDSLNFKEERLIKKPFCCVQLSPLSNNMNIAKDNLLFGCCVGSPVTGSIMVSIVGFVFVLVIGIFEVIFTLGQSKTIINSLGQIGVPIFITLVVLSSLLSLFSIIFVPYYDYSENVIKSSYKNLIVLFERSIGCIGSVGVSLLLFFLILKNNTNE
ncbi:MAG: hypothetical protein ABIN00_02665 [candidate division WOR-3 bacterium]